MQNLPHRITHPHLSALSLAAMLALSTWPALLHAENSQAKQEVVGRWLLTAALDGAEIVSLDEREAQQLVGKIFVIEKTRIKFKGRVCSSPDFSSERVEPRLYLAEYYHANPEKLGLPDPVTVVHLDCTSVFVKNTNRLVIAWKGWFFDAARITR